MEELLRSVLGEAQGPVAYATVFGILVACGLGVPLPEDISLILGGYLAHINAVNLPAMMVVGFVGILCGDSLIYMAGRRVGTRVGSRGGLLAKVVTPEKRARVELLFAKHGQKIVMIARFLPGVRAVTYFTAGSAKMSYWRFIFWDGLAALASAPVFVYLGYRFGSHLEVLIDKLKHGQMQVIGAVAVLGLGYLLYTRIRKRRAAALAAAAGVAPVSALGEGEAKLQTGDPASVSAPRAPGAAERFVPRDRPPLLGK